MKARCDLSSISDNQARTECFKKYHWCDVWELVITYESDYTNTRLLRDIVDDFCVRFNVPVKWRTRIVLIFDELNNNAIEHGGVKGDAHICYIALKKIKKGIIVSWYVEDTGNTDHAKSYLELRELQKSMRHKDFSQHTPIRGRGLFLIISQIVDVLEFQESSLGGVRVYFEKTITLNS